MGALRLVPLLVAIILKHSVTCCRSSFVVSYRATAPEHNSIAGLLIDLMVIYLIY